MQKILIESKVKMFNKSDTEKQIKALKSSQEKKQNIQSIKTIIPRALADENQNAGSKKNLGPVNWGVSYIRAQTTQRSGQTIILAEDPYKCRSHSLQTISDTFMQHLMHRMPEQSHMVTKLWTENPGLAIWFGSEIKKKRIPLIYLNHCFNAALTDPVPCVEILLCILKNSEDLKTWLRNLPFSELGGYLKSIINSKSIDLVDLIWMDNKKLHKSMNVLSDNETKLWVDHMLTNILVVAESGFRFLETWLNNIDKISLLDNVFKNLPSYSRDQLSTKEAVSDWNKKMFIKQRIKFLNKQLAVPTESLKRVQESDTDAKNFYKRLKISDIDLNNLNKPEPVLCNSQDIIPDAKIMSFMLAISKITDSNNTSLTLEKHDPTLILKFNAELVRRIIAEENTKDCEEVLQSVYSATNY
jgi:hypothetical protein